MIYLHLSLPNFNYHYLPTSIYQFPGFSQRFAAFRQGLVTGTHTTMTLGASMVYPQRETTPMGFDSSTTAPTPPTPFTNEEATAAAGGGNNQGGDSATKRKEGGVCESDSATKKTKITGSTHCSSPINRYYTPYQHIHTPCQFSYRQTL